MVVNRDDKRGRASSFGEVADAYERARPGYTEEAARWLTGEPPCDVVDLGAGTGKLTRTLVALGHRVTPVEPLERMRAQLEAAVSDVVALAGTAERIPLPDGQADVVTCAQSFHWFDHPAALREIARVLRPGGRLSLVWNMRDDREPWVAKLSETVLGNETIDVADVQEPIAASGLFGAVEHATFSFLQPLDRSRLLELVRSRSYCAVRSEEERAPMLEEVGRIFDEHAVDGAIELPYVTECFRAAVAP